MMTRKDYVAIAKVINELQPKVFRGLTIIHATKAEVLDETRAAIAHGLADYMEYDNPNFNRSKFIEACSRVEVQAVPSDTANIYIHTLNGGDTNG